MSQVEAREKAQGSELLLVLLRTGVFGSQHHLGQLPASLIIVDFDVYTRKVLSAGCRVLAHFCFCRVCTATLTSEVRGQSTTRFFVITTGKPLWGKLSKIYVVDWILLRAFLRSGLVLIAESI